eukprot:1963912-Rhodomonas_salina.1
MVLAYVPVVISVMLRLWPGTDIRFPAACSTAIRCRTTPCPVLMHTVHWYQVPGADTYGMLVPGGTDAYGMLVPGPVAAEASG